LSPFVPVVDPTNTWQSDYLGVAGRAWVDRPVLGAVSTEGEVAPVLVVVGDVLDNQLASMGLVEDYNVVEELRAETSNPPFSNPVLPRGTESDSDGLHARCVELANHRSPECRVPIVDDEPGARYRLEGFPQLLGHPL